jgi:hypothetical protein
MCSKNQVHPDTERNKLERIAPKQAFVLTAILLIEAAFRIYGLNSVGSTRHSSHTIRHFELFSNRKQSALPAPVSVELQTMPRARDRAPTNRLRADYQRADSGDDGERRLP